MFNVKKILLFWKSENAIGVVLCSIFSAISLYFLISLKPPSSKSNHPVIAQIKKFDPGSKQRLAGTISFIDIESNNKLQNNDEIYTGKNSKITIEFLSSKNQVVIPSGSLVRVENNVDGEVLEIKEGRADITIKQGMVAKIISDGQTIQLTNTNAEDGTIRAYKVKDKITFNQIKTGNPKHEMKLMKIEQIETKPIPEVGATESLQKPKPPPPPVIVESHFELSLPSDGQQFGMRDEIKLKWSGSEFINVSVARAQDQLFEGKSKKLSSSPALLPQTLELGSWYLGIESEKGEKTVIPIEIINDFKITNAKPANDEILELNPGTSIQFSWSPLSAKSFEIYIKDSKENIIKSNTTINSFKLEHPTGTFIEWYVTPILSDGAKAPSSKLMKFNLKFTGELKFTGKLASSNIFQLSDKRIPITWNSQAFNRFTLFNEKDEKILEKETKSSSLDLTTLKLGLYKLKLESIDFPSLKSATSTLEIHTPIVEWESKNKNIFTAYDPKAEVSIYFKSAIDGKDNLIPVINFNNIDLKNEEANLQVEKQRIVVTLKDFGHYCLRINPISVLKYYDESSPYCFEFKELIPFKIIPTLKPATLKHTFINDFDAYTTSIPTVERATKYHFQIFKSSDMRDLIFEFDSEKPSLTWMTKRSGIFYYRYKVYDYKNRESNYSNLSKFILPISPFSKLKDE